MPKTSASTDLHDRWPHRWLNSKVKSFSSPIHGLGLVSLAEIKKDEVILVYGGIVVPASEIQDYWDRMSHVGIQISDGFFICPATREELETTGVVNHSCEPNAGFSSPIHLVALKDIEAGQEIAFDYAFIESSFSSFRCNCKTANCREMITQDDWKIKSIQEKFGAYFSPYLKQKIEAG
jgi:SET domain-containing protein